MDKIANSSVFVQMSVVGVYKGGASGRICWSACKHIKWTRTQSLGFVSAQVVTGTVWRGYWARGAM